MSLTLIYYLVNELVIEYTWISEDWINWFTHVIKG